MTISVPFAVYENAGDFFANASGLPNGTPVVVMSGGVYLCSGVYNGDVMDVIGGVNIPVRDLQADASTGYNVEEGSDGFTVEGDGSWTLASSPTDPIVRVRFPCVGLGNRASSFGVTLASFATANATWTAGRADLNTSMEVRAIGEDTEALAYSSQLYSATSWGLISTSFRVYSITKTAPTTFTFDGVSVVNPLYHEHQIIPNAGSNVPIGRSIWRDTNRADITNSYGYGVSPNTGIALDTDDWLWELEVHHGGGTATLSVNVTHVCFNPGGEAA